MSNRTYSKCPHGHRMYFDPHELNLRQWWCQKCAQHYKLTPKEKRLVMVAYNHGREKVKEEIKTNIKNLLNIN